MQYVGNGKSYDPETQEVVRVRRGAHWRNQRFGPDRSMTRRIRIKACYVLVVRPLRGNYQLPLDIPPGAEDEKDEE
jgi:hypothetical protein